MAIDLNAFRSELATITPVVARGRVLEVNGPTIKANLTGAATGDIVSIEKRSSKSADSLSAQVVAFQNDIAILSPFGNTDGILPGAHVALGSGAPRVELGPHLLGAVVDSMGNVIRRIANESNSSGRFQAGKHYTAAIENPPPNALSRRPISSAFATGVRAIDAFTTLGVGQRLSVFAEPGVGKTTLLGMIARNSTANVNIIALIGERGREVNELLADTLDEESAKRSVIVVSTSDEAAISRVTAAKTATRIAEYFRDQGQHVLLQLDSLTRLFRAYREVGLAAGEMPVRRGYPPSVFAELPRLIERTGVDQNGAITALYTVLLSSEFDEDPMVEEVKGLTDGHIVLRRAISERGHYPAISISESVSRLANRVCDAQQQLAARIVRAALAKLENERELAALSSTNDPHMQFLLTNEHHILRFLQQPLEEPASLEDTQAWLLELAQQLDVELG